MKNLKTKTTASLIIALLVLSVFTPLLIINVPIANAYGADAHQHVIDDALELIGRDPSYSFVYSLFNDPTLKQALKDGAYDADHGSDDHGWKYNIQEPLIDMDNFGPTEMAAGGFSHMFDVWTHQGVCFIEDPEEVKALLYVGEFLVGLLVSVFLGPLGDMTYQAALAAANTYLEYLVDHIKAWTDFQGKNAGECVILNYDRAVEAWNSGDHAQAAYWLGYVLHVISDVTIPFHAANTLLSGHDDYENWVGTDITNANNQGYGSLYNTSDYDHVISFDDLGPLSIRLGGPLISGDSLQLYGGHITSGSVNPAWQFLDFAGHESLPWYPLVNDAGAGSTIQLTSSWGTTFWNWLEAYDLYPIDRPQESRLMFHFHGTSAMTVHFGMIGGWWPSDWGWDIDFDPHWWSDPIGFIEVLAGYPVMSQQLLGRYDSEFFDPAPSTTSNTVEIRTHINAGDSDSCPGWAIESLDLRKIWGQNEVLSADPLQTDRQQGLSLLDEPIEDRISQDPALQAAFDGGAFDLTAKRIAAVHMMNLAIRSVAGMLCKFFSDNVASEDTDQPQGSLTILGDRALYLSLDSLPRSTQFSRTRDVSLCYSWEDHGPVSVRFRDEGSAWGDWTILEYSWIRHSGGGYLNWTLPGDKGVKWVDYEVMDSASRISAYSASIIFTDAERTSVFFDLTPNPGGQAGGTLDEGITLNGVLVNETGDPIQTLPVGPGLMYVEESRAAPVPGPISISYCQVDSLFGKRKDTQNRPRIDLGTDSNGKFSVNIPTPSDGLYVFEVKYYADPKHFDSKNTAFLFVNYSYRIESDGSFNSLYFNVNATAKTLKGIFNPGTHSLPSLEQAPTMVQVSLSADFGNWTDVGTATVNVFNGFFSYDFQEAIFNMGAWRPGTLYLIRINCSGYFVVTCADEFAKLTTPPPVQMPHLIRLRPLYYPSRPWTDFTVELPLGIPDLEKIQLSSLNLNGTIRVESSLVNSADYDNDGVNELALGFNRTTISNYAISMGAVAGNVTFTLIGRLVTGQYFSMNIMTQVKMPGDVNMDCKVDIYDALRSALAYGTTSESLGYSALADENEDGQIDVFDLVLVSRHFGNSYV